jgi:hypothetical protein
VPPPFNPSIPPAPSATTTQYGYNDTSESKDSTSGFVEVQPSFHPTWEPTPNAPQLEKMY